MAKLYSALKFLRFTKQIEALVEGRLVAPVHVRIKPINRCNHHCWYCAYRTDDLKLGEDMDESDVIPEAKMMEIVEDLIEMGIKAVTFSGGGEPLLYKPLPVVVETLAKAGIRVATLTNGTNLRGRMADAFAKHGTWVRVSVDAWDNESYQASRGAKPNEFDKLLDNMRAFTARGSDCVLGVSFIIGRNNYQRIAEVCRMFRDVGVDHVKLSAAVVANDVAQNNAYHRELMTVVNAEIEKAQQLQTDRFKVLNHFHETEERFEKEYTSCPFLQFLTVIGADQTVYTCQDKAYTVPGTLGSIKDKRFKDFWFSEENRETLRTFDPSQKCKHHCVAHNKNLALLDYLSIDTNHGAFV